MATAWSLVLRMGVDTAALRTGAMQVKGLLGQVGVTSQGMGNLIKGSFAAARDSANLFADATRTVTSTTGETGDAALKTADNLKQLWSNDAHIGITQVGDLLTVLHNDMNLTGDAALEVGRKFIEFAHATNQSASAAAAAFDNIADSWGVGPEKFGEIMDKLVFASHHGAGSVVELQGTIARLAPVMKAANMSMDEGIGLLNMFGDAGISASMAPRALQQALAKVKSPEALKAALKDIQGTEDAFKRGEKAAKIFGTRVGQQMSQALKPGSKSLEDYVARLQDVDGATTQAAEAMDNQLGTKITIAFRKFQVGASDFLVKLNPIAPALTAVSRAAAQIGPALGIDIVGSFSKAGDVIVKGFSTVAARAADAFKTRFLTDVAGMETADLAANLVAASTPQVAQAGAAIGEQLTLGLTQTLADPAVAQGAAGTIIGNLSGQAIAAEAKAAGAAVGVAQQAGMAEGIKHALPVTMSTLQKEAIFGIKPVMTGVGVAAGEQLGLGLGDAVAKEAAGPGIASKLVGGLKSAIFGPIKIVGAFLAGAFNIAYTAVAAVLGPLLAPIFTAMQLFLAPIIATVGTLLGTVLAGAIAIGVALAPFILIAAVIALVLAVVNDPELRNKIIDFGVSIIKFIVDGMVKVGHMVADVISDIFDGAVKFIGSIIGKALSAIIEPVRAVVDILSKIPGPTQKMFEDLRDSIDHIQDDLDGTTEHLKEMAAVQDDLRESNHSRSLGVIEDSAAAAEAVMSDADKVLLKQRVANDAAYIEQFRHMAQMAEAQKKAATKERVRHDAQYVEQFRQQAAAHTAELEAATQAKKDLDAVHTLTLQRLVDEWEAGQKNLSSAFANATSAVNTGVEDLNKAMEGLGKPQTLAHRISVLTKFIKDAKATMIKQLKAGDIPGAMFTEQQIVTAQGRIDTLKDTTTTSVEAIVADMDRAGIEVPAAMRDMWTGANGATNKGAAKHALAVKKHTDDVARKWKLMADHVGDSSKVAAVAPVSWFNKEIIPATVAARGVAGGLTGAFNPTWQTLFYGFGDHASNQLILGWSSNWSAANTAGNDMAKAFIKPIAHSLPDPSSPFYGEEKWLGHAIDNIVAGGRRHLHKLRSFGTDMADAINPMSATSLGGTMTAEQTIHLRVHDEDGGLAKAGVSEEGLASALTRGLRINGPMRYRTNG